MDGDIQSAQPANQVGKASAFGDDALYGFSSDSEDDSFLSENELLSSFLNPPPKSHLKAYNKSKGSK